MRTLIAQRGRIVAVVAATLTSALYFLIGLGVLPIGQSTTGGNANLLQFGLTTGTAFAVVAAVLVVARGRLALVAVGGFTALVIVAYFAFAGLREPPFAIWGLVVKSVQVVLLAAVAYVAVRGSARRSTPTPAAQP